MSLGGSGVSIGGVGSLRVDFFTKHAIFVIFQGRKKSCNLTGACWTAAGLFTYMMLPMMMCVDKELSRESTTKTKIDRINKRNVIPKLLEIKSDKYIQCEEC